jgi:hypothetical protein
VTLVHGDCGKISPGHRTSKCLYGRIICLIGTFSIELKADILVQLPLRDLLVSVSLFCTDLKNTIDDTPAI